MKITIYPDPILTMLAKQCEEKELGYIKSVVPEMTKLMLQAKGVGLAAPQVGISKRFCLVVQESSLKQTKPRVNLIINPELLEGDQTTRVIKDEGCLSLPLFQEKIIRYSEVTVKFTDENWVERKAVFVGLEAQCIQHEIEHLDGKLITEYMSPMKRQMYIKKLKKNAYL